MLGNTLRLTHGQTHTRLHHIWHGIKQRCLNPKSYIYKNYGGRGITVCDEWRDSFEVFYGWAMANGYADDLTIDRIDVNGNYEPLNCRWATSKEQGNNRRTNHLLTYKGQTRTTQEWADIKGLSRECIRWRLA
ncbi:MAG: hypothetical protein J6W28_08845, partial [Clostridia bacterium]|nr:hypothetical protein [Clostridia bacterium]